MERSLNMMWKNLLSLIDKNPFMENFAILFVIAIFQLLLGAPVALLLKTLGVANPSSELVTISCLVAAVFIIGLPLHVFLYIGKRRQILQLSEKAGLTTIWRNFESVKEEIRRCLMDKKNPVKEVRVLIHGGSNLINGSSSVLGNALEEICREAPHRKPRTIKIICSSLDSPYYTNPEYLRDRFISRKNDRDANWSEEAYVKTTIEKFQSKTRLIHARIRNLVNYGLDNVEVHDHNEPYLWNLIILDNKVFAQGDVYRNTLKDAPIMVFQESLSGIEKNESHTYYYTFSKYFDDIWHRKSRNIQEP